MGKRYTLRRPWVPANRWRVAVGETFGLPEDLSDAARSQVAEAVKRGILEPVSSGRPSKSEAVIEPAAIREPVKRKPKPTSVKKRAAKAKAKAAGKVGS